MDISPFDLVLRTVDVDGQPVSRVSCYASDVRLKVFIELLQLQHVLR